MNRDYLASLTQVLYNYDVRDGGWEHEDKGVGFNVTHVYKELVGSALNKDYTSPSVARNEVAPDSLQYALRFARWLGFELELLVPGKPEHDSIRDLSKVTGVSESSRAAVLAAVAVLHPVVHDLDHTAKAEAANDRLNEVVQPAGRLLVLSAFHQAGSMGFNLTSAFSGRLTVLRRRFGVEPRTD